MPGNYYTTQASFVETIFHFIKELKIRFNLDNIDGHLAFPSEVFSVLTLPSVHINFISLNCKLIPIPTQNGKLLVRTPWNSDIDGLP